MENITPVRKRTTVMQLVLGGALIGGALFVSFNFASSYDQQNTHPALTDEAIDFYNLSFPGKRLTEDDKKWLTKGAIDEDTAPRPLNHFYDPIYNQGWIGYTPSKIWAYSSEKQVAFLSGKSQTAGFAQFLVGDELSADDYSYQRALYDYAVGDRERAMLAMGHIMHLLEDANVPDHTRNDTHLPWAGTESPYEQTMARWNPSNLDIASKIFANGVKPILLSGLGDYFDKIAKYSNGYFFSEDTILSERYALPRKVSEKFIEEDGVKKRFTMGRDRNGELFPLFRIDSVQQWRNLTTETKFTINSPVVLNDYWSRLSKDFVPLGAGALKLFLGQAEKVRKEYPNSQKVSQKPGALGGILGLLGVSGQGGQQLTFDPALIDSILGGTTIVTYGVGAPPTPYPTPSATSLPTPSTPLPTSLLVETPTPTPLNSYGSGGSGGGGGGSGNIGGGGSGGNSYQNTVSSTPTPSPSPTPSPTFSPTPTPTPTPSSTITPTPTPTPTPSPTSTPEPIQPGTAVVINEIAWMGTATSSNDEWLELYNITSKSVDLGGWRLHSLTGNNPDPDITFASKSIEPFGFFLLERTDDTTVSDISADQIYKGGLNNDGEVLELRDKDGGLQDLVSKSADGWYAGKNDGKYTMERINPTKIGDDSANWATNNGVTRNGHDAAGNPINGTPRARNSAYVNQKPTKITDLVVDSSSFFGKIKLTWSAPKDDDNPQGDLKYNLRYATRSFDTLADWEGAAKVASPSMPSQVADYGQPQSSSFTIFDYNADYYFAIKTCDKEACSDISNQPEYAINPAISDDPTAFRGPAGPATISWEFQLPAGFNVNQPGLARDGTVYFGSHNNFQGKLYAINPNGTEKWRLDGFSNRPPAFPIVADDGVVYSDADSQVYAVNPDKTIRWQYAGASGPVGKVSIDVGGNVMFTDTANIPVNDRVFKIKPDGTVKWGVFLLTASGFTPITGPNGDVFTSSRWGANGIPRYYRLNGDNGMVGWQVSPSASSVYASSDLVYDKAENKLYATGASGFRIFTINPSDEQLTEDMIKPFAANPTTKVTISDDLLVVGATLIVTNPASGSAVYGIDKATKSVRWTFPISASTSVDPYNSMVNKEIIADVDGNFYFSTKGGRVYSINREGQERWVLDLGAPTELYPVLGENAVFIGIGGASGGKLVKIADY